MMRLFLAWMALALTASAQVLPWNEFLAMALDRSGEVRIAEAKVREAQAKRMAAFAAFEPRLDLASEGKDYGNDLQYRLDRAEARVGLPGGIDLVGGAAQATGAFINPERKTPVEGLVNLGISAPLGGALIYSDRQYAWNAASRDLEVEQAKRDRVERKLRLEAVKVYTFWQAQVEVQSAVDEAVAVLSWVDRRTDASKQQSFSAVARANVERMLRGADDVEADLSGVQPDSRPVLLGNSPFASAEPQSLNGVPELAMVSSLLRRERLAVTTAWAQWLPAPYVDYRMLQWGGSTWNPEAVQWKVGLALPLFNQKARADLAGAQARLRAAEANAASVQNEVEVLQRQLAQQVAALDSELKALLGAEAASYALLQQERRRFTLGESTMFILASRETKYLEAVQKRTMASAKLQSLEAERRLLTRPSL
ncbi:MAG: hypothetical protein RL104_1093 [Bacteroidota bacterium]